MVSRSSAVWISSSYRSNPPRPVHTEHPQKEHARKRTNTASTASTTSSSLTSSSSSSTARQKVGNNTRARNHSTIQEEQETEQHQHQHQKELSNTPHSTYTTGTLSTLSKVSAASPSYSRSASSSPSAGPNVDPSVTSNSNSKDSGFNSRSKDSNTNGKGKSNGGKAFKNAFKMKGRNKGKQKRKEEKEQNHDVEERKEVTIPKRIARSSSNSSVNSNGGSVSAEVIDEYKALMTKEFPAKDPENTSLHIACLKHYSDSLIIDYLLQQGPDAVSKPNTKSELPLHCAMRDNHHDSTQWHDLNETDDSLRSVTGVHIGVTDKVLDNLLCLHPNGVNHANVDGCLPIHLACYLYGSGRGTPSGASSNIYSSPANMRSTSMYALQRLMEVNSNTLVEKCQLALPFDPKAKEHIQKRQGHVNENENEENGRSTNGCFWDVLSAISPTPKNSFEESDTPSTTDSQPKTDRRDIDSENTESDFTPLHLAVLSGAPPDIIELILNTNPNCLRLRTNRNRTAIDIAKYAVIERLSSTRGNTFHNDYDEYSDDENDEGEEEPITLIPNIKNIFAAIEVLETFEVNERKQHQLQTFISAKSFILEKNNRSTSFHTTPRYSINDQPQINSLISNRSLSLSKSQLGQNQYQAQQHPQQIDNMLTTIDTNESTALNSSSTDEKEKNGWTNLNLAAVALSHIKSSLMLQSPLGQSIPIDEEEVDLEIDCPTSFTQPTKLAHLCVDIELPVGFRRLRRAILHSSSTFCTNELQRNKLHHSDIKLESWDKYNEYIGLPENPEGIKNSDFIGVERNSVFTIPKSLMIKANKAYENTTIIEYNDYCFAIKKVTTNPDVPFGSTFECHTLMVFTNLGMNSCRLVGSVEAKFLGRPPMIAWKIKNGMYSGVTDFFVAKGEVICDHAD